MCDPYPCAGISHRYLTRGGERQTYFVSPYLCCPVPSRVSVSQRRLVDDDDDDDDVELLYVKLLPSRRTFCVQFIMSLHSKHRT